MLNFRVLWRMRLCKVVFGVVEKRVEGQTLT